MGSQTPQRFSETNFLVKDTISDITDMIHKEPDTLAGTGFKPFPDRPQNAAQPAVTGHGGIGPRREGGKNSGADKGPSGALQPPGRGERTSPPPGACPPCSAPQKVTLIFLTWV